MRIQRRRSVKTWLATSVVSCKNDHKQVRCQDFVNAWEECVAKVNEQEAAKAESG